MKGPAGWFGLAFVALTFLYVLAGALGGAGIGPVELGVWIVLLVAWIVCWATQRYWWHTERR